MRKIKFRFWDVEYKEMCGDIICRDDSDLNDNLNDDMFLPMQYTGLTDKNGKEIYEGDIFENDPHEMPYMSVVWDNNDASWAFSNGDAFSDYNLHEMEISGNIYEDEGLLND